MGEEQGVGMDLIGVDPTQRQVGRLVLGHTASVLQGLGNSEFYSIIVLSSTNIV